MPLAPMPGRSPGPASLLDAPAVTPETPFRETGDTTRDAFARAIGRGWSGGRSPMANEAAAIYAAVPRALRRLCVAVSFMETKNHSFPDSLATLPAWTHNAWALTGAGDVGSHGRWAAFASYAAAARTWAARLLDGNGPYRRAVTLRDLIRLYAPPGPPDFNDVGRYLAVVVGEINALPVADGGPGRATATTPRPKGIARRGPEGPPPAPSTPTDPLRHVACPGTPGGLWLPSDVEWVVNLTPKGPNRPGEPMRPRGTTIHETGNRGLGTGAVHHANWQKNGTPGHPDGKVGVHLYADDRAIVLCIPLDETSIHAGNPRNGTDLSVEICVNADRDGERAERNAAHLAATLLRDVIGPMGSRALSPHRCGTGCPAIICGSGRWGLFVATVRTLIDGSVPPPPTYAPTKPLPWEWDGEDKEVGGVRFVAIRRVFRAAEDDVPALQYADPRAAPVRRPLPKGEGFEALYLTTGADGRPWFVTRFFSRIPADRCTPRITIADVA